MTRDQFDAIPLINLISQRYIDKIHRRAKDKILIDNREYMAPRSRYINLRYAVVCETRAMVKKVRDKKYTAILVNDAIERARLHQSSRVWRQLARERNQDQDPTNPVLEKQ